eukprot:490628_1
MTMQFCSPLRRFNAKNPIQYREDSPSGLELFIFPLESPQSLHKLNEITNDRVILISVDENEAINPQNQYRSGDSDKFYVPQSQCKYVPSYRRRPSPSTGCSLLSLWFVCHWFLT